MSNPSDPILPVNRMAKVPGAPAILIDSPLAFSHPDDAAAFFAAGLAVIGLGDVDGGAPDSVYTYAGLDGGSP